MSSNNRKMWSKKKKVFLVGPMGSGKTEIAVNYALGWKNNIEESVSLIDLDMVKPYFRLRSVKSKFQDAGVEVIVPPESYGYADFPIITPRMESCIIDPNSRAVIDIGGEDNGARLAGRYRGIINPDIVDLFYVFNARRPGANDPGEAPLTMELIQRAAGFKITGIINNTNLMQETTLDIIIDEVPRAKELSREMGLPLVFSCVREDLYSRVKDVIEEPILPLKLFLTPEWADS